MRWRCAVAAWAITSSVARADEPSEARAHFQAGVNFVRDPAGAKYEEAYREFKLAYALSSSPKILGNLGLAAMKLERDAEAIEAYSKCLAAVEDIPPQEREQIARDLETLKTSAVPVTLKLDVAGLLRDTRMPNSGDPSTRTARA